MVRLFNNKAYGDTLVLFRVEASSISPAAGIFDSRNINIWSLKERNNTTHGEQKGSISPYQNWILARQTPARRNRYEIRIYIQYRHDTQCHIFSLLRMEQLAHCVKDHFAHPRKASNCEHIDATQHIWKAQAQSIQPSFIASYDLSAHSKEL